MILNLAIFIAGILHSGLFTAVGLGVTLANPSFGLSLLCGYWTGIFVNSQIWLPLIYALPKSINLFLKKKIRFKAIFTCFIPPLIWQILLIILYLASQSLFPQLNEYISSSHGFNFGWFLSIFRLIYATYFTTAGRNDARKDYEEVFYKKYKL